MNNTALFTLFLILSFLSFSEDESAMRSPVDHRIKLSGTFGELRSNHFHSGLDIKSSKGAVGDPVYSVWEGRLSRIAVKSTGYGNALYIDHPNGKTTVYAHLDRFREDIAKYVKEQQYILESYEVNLYPPDSLFKFEKGDFVAKMGNSGRSYGPHLHFEIRDTDSEVPLNPLIKGADVIDKIPPQIREIKLDYMDSKHRSFYQKKYSTSNLRSGKYKIQGDTIYAGAWRVGIQAKSYDLMDGASNLNGIYRLQLKVDGIEEFSFRMDSISFDDTRYLNAHLDYQDRIKNKSYFHRCYRLPGNQLSIYTESGDKGVIKLYEKKARKVEILCADNEGNESNIAFWVKRSSTMKEPKYGTHNYTWPWKEKALLKNADGNFQFPANCFYEDPSIDYAVALDTSADLHSWSHDIDNQEDPIHKYFTVQLEHKRVPDHLLDKAFIAKCRTKGGLINCGAEIDGNAIQTKVREMGQFVIGIDTVAPTIKPYSFRTDMSARKTMSFTISDDISVSGSARRLQYRAEVDGQWILMVKDSKSNRIVHRFDGTIGRGSHELVLKLWDDRDNITEFRKQFSR